MAGALLAGALLAHAALRAIGARTGPVETALGLLAALLPAPIYVLAVLWLDRLEPEPPAMLLWCLGWGATAAYGMALWMESAMDALTAGAPASWWGALPGPVSWGPLIEETMKLAGLLPLVLWWRREIDSRLDGAVYGAMCGVGFGVAENVLYYALTLHDPAREGAAATFLARGAFAPLTHGFFSAVAGTGLWMACRARRPLFRQLAAPAGLAAAVTLHAAWNLAAVSERWAARALVLFVVVYPSVRYAVLAAMSSLREEAAFLRERLRPELESGLLTADEYAALTSLRGRARASLAALRRGIDAWLVREECHRVASDLAYLRRCPEGARAAAEDECRDRLAAACRRLRG